uniref:NYN domain-containing protein n=1 Tax=Noccaea caerulescens TaxID=107243 RepID=A0A1J3GXB0_NOCCA
MNTKKTTVLWDINGCPIPDGFDPRLVGRRIESALKNSGCCGSGPLTITAIGDLRQTGDEVLRHLSSTGIALEHSYDFNLYSQTYINQKPYTKMLISGLSTLDSQATTLHDLANQEYTILLAYPRRDEDRDWLWKSFLRRVTKEWLWKSLLEDETDSGTAHETTRLVIQDKSPFSPRISRVYLMHIWSGTSWLVKTK